VLPNGTAHISITHIDIHSPLEERKPHRILCNVPPADVRPPEGIPSLQLQAVRFSLNLLEPRHQSRKKRLKPKSVERPVVTSNTEDEGVTDERADLKLHDLTPARDPAKFESALNDPAYATTPPNLKRKRQNEQVSTTASVLPLPTLASSIISHRRGVTTQVSTSTNQYLDAKEELEDIRHMIDGAIRLSICGLNKSQGSFKLKANTFNVGLADVVPTLWRPEYLGVGRTCRGQRRADIS
jgi:hypothetical protein